MVGAFRSAGRSSKEVEAWVRGIIPRAVAYARTLLAQRTDAEDVVHEVLCRMFDHKEYDLIADGEKILFRSITNACINRTQRRRNIASLDATIDDETRLGSLVPSKKADDPADLASAAELREAVQTELADLPEMQRAALELKSMRYSLNEIARMLNVSASNAGVLVHRARRRLAARLTRFLPSGFAARG